MIRCLVCGRFISYHDFEEGKAKTYYEPDSHYSRETIEHIHFTCDTKENPGSP